MVAVWGDILWPPHCATPAAVKANKNKIGVPLNPILLKILVILIFQVICKSVVKRVHCRSLVQTFFIANLFISLQIHSHSRNLSKGPQEGTWEKGQGWMHYDWMMTMNFHQWHTKWTDHVTDLIGWKSHILLIPPWKQSRYMSCSMTKPTEWPVHPAKTLIRVFAMHPIRCPREESYPLRAQRRLRSAWASAQAVQSLRCALNG